MISNKTSYLLANLESARNIIAIKRIIIFKYNDKSQNRYGPFYSENPCQEDLLWFCGFRFNGFWKLDGQINDYFKLLNSCLCKVCSSAMSSESTFGGTLFRNLPKILNFHKTVGPSCSGSKIVPARKIGVYSHIQESSNRIQRLEIVKIL